MCRTFASTLMIVLTASIAAADRLPEPELDLQLRAPIATWDEAEFNAWHQATEALKQVAPVGKQIARVLVSQTVRKAKKCV